MSDLSHDLASLRIQRDEAPPPRPGRAVALLAALVVVSGLVVGGVLFVPMLGARVFQTEVEVTSISVVSPAQSSTLVTSTGYVVAQTASKVGARVLGRVAEVRVREGQAVNAGDVLVRLDDAEQRTALAAARARATAARARTQAARASLDETRRQYERERDLAAQGASARSVAEDLALRTASLEEAARAAEADAAAAEAELDQLSINLDYLTVTAPISGVVTAKPVEVGELVGPTTPEPVAELADFATLMVETDVPEGRLGLITPGGPAEIVLDAFPSVRRRGEVVEVSPRVNRVKATVVVRVRFVDPAEGVLPEMAARVGFLEGALDPDAMREPPKPYVPASAVAVRGADKVVFRIDEGKARLERVTLGAPMGNGFELTQGPAAGTQLVANPPPTLQDGYPVKERSR
jgi:RND family efflux transporter MFP subunit